MAWTLSGFADEAGMDIDVQIETIKQAGFNYIDLRNLNDMNIAELPIDAAEQIKGKLGDAAIKVGMFGSPIGKIDIADDMQTDLDKLEHLGKLADIFDCRKVRVFSYFNEKGASPDEWRDESIKRLGQLRDQLPADSLGEIVGLGRIDAQILQGKNGQPRRRFWDRGLRGIPGSEH